MTAQASLFDTPAVRDHDRPTATAAAESMTGEPRIRQADRALVILADIERRKGGATAWEIHGLWPYLAPPAPDQSVIARRLTDLARAGLIEDTGTSRTGKSGRLLTVWRLTDDGRARVAAQTEGDTP